MNNNAGREDRGVLADDPLVVEYEETTEIQIAEFGLLPDDDASGLNQRGGAAWVPPSTGGGDGGGPEPSTGD